MRGNEFQMLKSLKESVQLQLIRISRGVVGEVQTFSPLQKTKEQKKPLTGYGYFLEQEHIVLEGGWHTPPQQSQCTCLLVCFLVVAVVKDCPEIALINMLFSDSVTPFGML